MTVIDLNRTVGELVTERPARSRIFEQLGIDYCCGGRKALADACAEQQLDPATVVRMLAATEQTTDQSAAVDAGAMRLTDLCTHIEQTHHASLRRELPRLDQITGKVASVHGERDPRLVEIRRVFVDFAAELNSHMMKEEQILFPMIRSLDQEETAPEFHCGSIANPIHQMEMEHDSAGDALARFRTLSDEFTPPDWACNTFRAMFDALRELEADMHQHVHKENNVLFPRAIEMQRAKTPPHRALANFER
jgi:regulator of cell morphogenesis and NO signaling